MKERTYFRIKITQAGYVFIALSLGVGFAALNTGNNLIYLIFSMMMSFLILSGLLSNNSLNGIFLRAKLPNRIFAEQSAYIHLELENRKKKFPSYSLLLRPQTEKKGDSTNAFIIKIPPKDFETTAAEIWFSHRGKARLPSYVIETSFPFGFIRKSKSVPSEGETIVYPKLIPVPFNLFANQKILGDFLSGQSGGSSNPYGIRDFDRSDPARIIHWKSSARTGELKVKEFEREKRKNILLDLHLASESNSTFEVREKAVSAAASLVLFFYEHGFEITLHINGLKVETQGRGYIDAYLSALALAHPLPKTSSFVVARGGETSVLITDRLDLGAENAKVFVGPRELQAL